MYTEIAGWHGKIQGQMLISKSNMFFQQSKVGTRVIPLFRLILTGKSISDIILMT